MAYGSSQVTGPIGIIAAGLQVASMRTRVQSLASISGLGIQHCVSCDVGCRWGLDPELLFSGGVFCLAWGMWKF